MVRIVIVDDHPAVRLGYKAEIEKKDNFAVVGEAGTAREAKSVIEEQKPDIVILDINLPDMSGVSLARDIKAFDPDIKILFVSMHRDMHYVQEAMAVGGMGYILKDSSISFLMNGIQSIASGGCCLDLKLSSGLVKYMQNNNKIPAHDVFDLLTLREKEIFRLVVQGYTSKEIGKMLSISNKTVQNHRSNILKKLKLHTTVELVKFAEEKGLVEKKYFS